MLTWVAQFTSSLLLNDYELVWLLGQARPRIRTQEWPWDADNHTTVKSTASGMKKVLIFLVFDKQIQNLILDLIRCVCNYIY